MLCKLYYLSGKIYIFPKSKYPSDTEEKDSYILCPSSKINIKAFLSGGAIIGPEIVKVIYLVVSISILK